MRGYAHGMARSNDPWQQVATLTGLAALVGAGAGASSALVFAERRATAQDREIASLEPTHDAGTPQRSGDSARGRTEQSDAAFSD
jgi:hypothetical protein